MAYKQLQGQRGALLLAFAALVAYAVVGVRCQDDEWHYSGNTQLVTVTSEDLLELFDSNDTAVESQLPGVLGVHSRKLLIYGFKETFRHARQDGSLFSIHVINSAGSTATFSQDSWGQSWYCIQQQVLKYTNCPGTWTVQIFCDNPSNACNLYYSISAFVDTSTCSATPTVVNSPPPPVALATQSSPPPPPPPSTLQSCQCTCCAGNYCSPSLVGSYNTASASQCTVSGCVQAYPTSCPAASMSGGTGAAYHAVSTSSTAYTTAQGSIALDTASVTDACKAVSFFQCIKTYSVDVSGSTFTLTSTSGTASECDTGLATLQNQGAKAVGYFSDGTVFTASNNGASISVDVDNGTCLGQYYVTSGGPILGVSKEASSARQSLAALPLGVVVGLTCTVWSMLM